MNLSRALALVRHIRANPQASFVPSPALAGFMTDLAPRILVRAGNRSGKSVHAAVKLARRMLAYPGRRYRAVGVNFRQSVGVISKLLSQYLPPDQIADGCVYTETNGWTHQLIRLKNGTTCQIRTSDQKGVAHAGDDLDGVWIDEPPTPDVWLECSKRVMSRGGFLWVTATPVGRPCGWLREIVEAEGSPWAQHVVEFNAANCPWYSREQVDAWLTEASAAPWAYRQTIFGDWEGEVIDRVFTGFDPECIIGDDDLPDSEPFKVGIGIDHGEGVGHQVAVLCMWTATCLYVVGETVNVDRSMPAQDARAILAALVTRGWSLTDVSSLVGDINSAGKMGGGLKVNDVLATELATAAKCRPGTVRIDPPSKGKGSVRYGEKLLNAAFMQGRLKIHSDCKGLIHALKNYSEGNEDLKHPIDALRYISQPRLEAWAEASHNISRLRIL